MGSRLHKKRSPSPQSATPRLQQSFNERATEVTEVEIKFLVKNDDPAAFDEIENYFTKLGLVRSIAKNNHLLTWQLDTPDMRLLKDGDTLRIRGECAENSLQKISTSDICLKTGKKKDESGALRRGEYESRIKDFRKITVGTLLTKYPKKQYPEVHAALKKIKNRDLVEFFRIDCIRNRYLIEMPESETGIAGKKAFAELILDSVAFVLDVPDLKRPLVFHYDMEVECEMMFKACAYDKSPDAHKHISSPMTRAETDRAMSAVKRHILAAAPGKLEENYDSKAERGFGALARLASALGDYLIRDLPTVTHRHWGKRSLKAIFRLSGCDADGNLTRMDGRNVDIYHKLARSFAFVFKRHNIAHNDYKPD